MDNIEQRCIRYKVSHPQHCLLYQILGHISVNTREKKGAAHPTLVARQWLDTHPYGTLSHAFFRSPYLAMRNKARPAPQADKRLSRTTISSLVVARAVLSSPIGLAKIHQVR